MLAPLRIFRRLLRTPSIPRQFPTAGFEVIASSHLVEEENWEWYSLKEFYPVRIGEVFKSQYQVVGKLGYGANGTTWLCRDFMNHKHVALKVATSQAVQRELTALKHFRTIKTSHAGPRCIRQMLDEFQLDNKDGTFHCIVYSPLSISLGSFRRMLRDRALPLDFLKQILRHLFIAIDFLHTEAKVIHTDIQENNIMLGMDEATAVKDLERFEQRELTSPAPRKIESDRIIYTSRPLVPLLYDYGRPVLCDFGEARFGDYDNKADIQPYQYRAPEVIFGNPWDEKVDIWNVGVMIWDMLGNGNLFHTTGGPEDKQDSMYHVAHMIALLGPPPKELLERTKENRVELWFGQNGEWKGAAEIPKGTLEDAAKPFKGAEQTLFLHFVRKMLKWKPEERSSARELLDDLWLNRT